MPKVIIDCDPGIDDCLALMLAVSCPELEIAGITTVSGNVPAHMGAENARKVLNQMNRLDIPVYIGESLPLQIPYTDAMDTHGQDGMGESGFPCIPGSFPSQTAVEFLEESLDQEEISIIALGPMTNLARLFLKRPDLVQRIPKLVSMGGSFKSHGNCSPVAEYNYWCDPHSAAICYDQFAKAGKQIHMIGLDVTRKILLTPSHVSYLERLNPEIGGFIRKITDFYMDFHWEYEGLIGCVINDPLAVAYFVDPSLCRGFDSFTAVETQGICRGQSVTDSMNFWKKEPNSHVLTETSCKEFMYFFFSRILKKTRHDLKLLEVL